MLNKYSENAGRERQSESEDRHVGLWLKFSRSRCAVCCSEFGCSPSFTVLSRNQLFEQECLQKLIKISEKYEADSGLEYGSWSIVRQVLLNI